MSRLSLVVAAAALACGLAVAASHATAQVDRKVEIAKARKMAAALAPGPYEVGVEHEGHCTVAHVTAATSRVWVGKFGCAGDFRPSASMRGGSITTTAPIPGVKVVTVVEVLKVFGTAELQINVFEEGGSWGPNPTSVSAPGTYTVSSTEFTMQPNKRYTGGVVVWLGSKCGAEFCGVSARIKEIKVDF